MVDKSLVAEWQKQQRLGCRGRQERGLTRDTLGTGLERRMRRELAHRLSSQERRPCYVGSRNGRYSGGGGGGTNEMGS